MFHEHTFVTLPEGRVTPFRRMLGPQTPRRGRPCLTEQREEPSFPGSSHPGDPLCRAVELIGPGKGLGLAPGTVEGANAVRADHLIGECFATPVLRQLHVEA